MHPEALLAPLASQPSRAAILLDVDGVLAPIVPRPEDARVPEPTQDELQRLVARYALVACVTGRTGTDARRIVGVDGIEYVGVHGLELEPEAEEWRARIAGFAASVAWPPEEVEDKGLTVSFHYRRLGPEAASEAERIAERARASDLVPLDGRQVLEIRPPVAANKGTAVRRLLGARGLRRALYAGDDTTDLDAFTALEGLEIAVRIAIASAEGPPELRAAADVVVESPAALAALLRTL